MGNPIDFSVLDPVKEWLAFYGYAAFSPADDTALRFIAAEEKQYIKNYCSVSQIPEALRFCLVDLILGRFLQHKKATGELEGFQLEAAVASIREGDTTVAFGDTTPSGDQRLDALIGYLTGRHRGELNKFRRIKW